jgi:peptidoglycan/LPS O-acetylase OafA/YrhL
MFALFTQHSFPPVSSGWTTMNQTIAALFFVALLYYSLNLNNPENKKGFHMRLLSLTWLRSIGKYSYAMYIFHLPVTLLLHTYLSKPLISDLPYISEDKKIAVFIIDLVCLFVSTYLLAWLSWRLIESKFLHFKRYFPMQKQKYI